MVWTAGLGSDAVSGEHWVRWGTMSYQDLPLFADLAEEQPSPATVVCADVLAWAETYTGPKFHALLTDSPYELSFMNRTWDASGISFKPETWKALAQHLLPGAFIMAFASSRGFHRVMTAMEDAGLRLYPAIFGWLSGSSFPKATRIDTQLDAAGVNYPSLHTLQEALRKAREAKGMTRAEVSLAICGTPSGACWNWESGLRVPTKEHWEQLQTVLTLPSALAETRDAAEREVVGQRTTGIGTGNGSVPIIGDGNRDLTAPATPLAQTWAGHRYGGQVLKNSLEPIIVAQVPYAGKPVQSIVEHGSGALNIDGGRLKSADQLGRMQQGHSLQRWNAATGHRSRDYHAGEPERWVDTSHGLGRYPPNFAICHTPDCVRVGTRRVQTESGAHIIHTHAGNQGYGGNRKDVTYQAHHDATGHETVDAWTCSDQCPVAALDRQAGVRSSGQMKAGTVRSNRDGYSGPMPEATLQDTYGDSGNVSRFFHVSSWSHEVAEQLAQAAPVFYAPKASATERNGGLRDHLPCVSHTDPSVVHEDDPVHSTEHYRLDAQGQPVRDQQGQIAWSGCRRNGHPTVKNIQLCQWLATLLLPPAAYAPRRLLVPFCGTASEMLGGMFAGFEEILGIEQDQSYVDIARQRIAYWQQQRQR